MEVYIKLGRLRGFKINACGPDSGTVRQRKHVPESDRAGRMSQTSHLFLAPLDIALSYAPAC